MCSHQETKLRKGLSQTLAGKQLKRFGHSFGPEGLVIFENAVKLGQEFEVKKKPWIRDVCSGVTIPVVPERRFVHACDASHFAQEKGTSVPGAQRFNRNSHEAKLQMLRALRFASVLVLLPSEPSRGLLA